MGNKCCKCQSSTYSSANATVRSFSSYNSSIVRSGGNHEITFGTSTRGDSLTTLTMKSSNNSDVGKDYRGGSTSTVGQEDPIPVFLRRLNDLNIRVGTRTRFLIEIDNPTGVQVRWFHNNQEAESDRYQYINEGGFYCLDIVPVTLQDEGLWVCTAQNYVGKSSTAAHLSLIVPKAFKKPIFVEQLKAVLTQRGIVSLECKVIGVPTPKLRWYKDDKEIKAGDIFALTANSNEDCLGIYTCEATNVMGTTLSTSKIHVAHTQLDEKYNADSLIPYGPPPKFLKGLKNVSGKVGNFLCLECQVEIPPWPQNIGWYNDSGIINEGPLYHLIADGLGMYGVEIKSLRADHNTTWKCVATSSTGSKAITSCLVSVSCPKNYRIPRFLESLRAVMTDEGLVSFECKVIGYPTPQLSWFKDGKQLQPGDVYELTGSKSLGSYCCVAQNCMGESSSIAELTIEDIQNQLNESEKLQLTSNTQPPRFLLGLKSTETHINESYVFMVKVTTEPTSSITWYKDDEQLIESNRYQFSSEENGTFILNIVPVEIDDQAEWKCVAINKFGQTVTSSFLKLNIPKNFKLPRFLEELRIAFSNEGSVNLECKVIGVPQPQLKWFKDGQELNPGDMHKIISGQSGTCCLGTYTCQAHNCMGTVSSSATLLTMEDKSTVKSCASEEYLSVINPLVRNESLSTIPEERTSQMEKSYTIEEPADVSFSFDGKEVTVSLYETPDLTHDEALQIIEMYADELSEHISEDNVVDLPSLRIVKQSSISGPVMMEALVIDVPTNFCQKHTQSDTDCDGVSLTEDITLENLDNSDSVCENSLEYFSDHLSSSNSKRDIFYSASETTPKNISLKPQSENDDHLSFHTPKLFMSNSDDQILTQLNMIDKHIPKISENVMGQLVRAESNNTEEEVSETLAEIDDELTHNYCSSKIVTTTEKDGVIAMNKIKNQNIELNSDETDTIKVISRHDVDEFLKYMKIILEGTMNKMHTHASCNFTGTPTKLERSIQALHSLAWKFIEETERDNTTELDNNITNNVSSLMTAINASLLALEQIDDPFGVSDNILNEIQSSVCFDLEILNNKQLLATEILDLLSDQIRNFIVVVNRQVAMVTEQRIIAVLRNTIGTTLIYIKQLQQYSNKIKCININSLSPLFSMVHPLETILNDLASLEELTNDDKRSAIVLKQMLIPPISSIAYFLDNLNTTLKNENSEDDQDLKDIFDRINISTNQFMTLASKGTESNNLAECFISFTKPINDLCCHLRRLGRSNENIVSSDYGSDDKLLLDFETLFDELMMDIDTLTNNVNIVRDSENNMNPLGSLLEPLQDIKIGLFQVNQVLLSNQTGSNMSYEVISCFEHLSQQFVQLNDCIINQSIVEETNKEMPFESSIKMMQNILFDDTLDDLGVNGILFGSVLKPLLQLQNMIVSKMASVESDLSFSEHTDVTSGGCNTQSLSLSLSNNAQTVFNNDNLKHDIIKSSKIDNIDGECGVTNIQENTSKMINEFILLENNTKNNLVIKKGFECDIGETFKDEEPNIITSEDDHETSGFEILFDETDVETISDFVEDNFDNIIQSRVFNKSSDLLLNEENTNDANVDVSDNIPDILEPLETNTQENSMFNSAVEIFEEVQDILKNTTEEVLDKTKQIHSLDNHTNYDSSKNVLDFIKEDRKNVNILDESLENDNIIKTIFPTSDKNDKIDEITTDILELNQDGTNEIDICDKDISIIYESDNIYKIIHDADSSVAIEYEDSDKLKCNNTFVLNNEISDLLEINKEEINDSINLDTIINLPKPSFVPDNETILNEDILNKNECVINSFIENEILIKNNNEQEIMFVEKPKDIVLSNLQNEISDLKVLNNENDTTHIENRNNYSDISSLPDKLLEPTHIECVNFCKDSEIMENAIVNSNDVTVSDNNLLKINNLDDGFIEVESKSIEIIKPNYDNSLINNPNELSIVENETKNVYSQYDVIYEETNYIQNHDTEEIIELPQTNNANRVDASEIEHLILNDECSSNTNINTNLEICFGQENKNTKEKDLAIEEINCLDTSRQDIFDQTENNLSHLKNIDNYDEYQNKSHHVCKEIVEEIDESKSSLDINLKALSDNFIINTMVEEQDILHVNNTNFDDNTYNEEEMNKKLVQDNLQENINTIILTDTQNLDSLTEMCENINIYAPEHNKIENCIPHNIISEQIINDEQILKTDNELLINNELNSFIIEHTSSSTTNVDNAIFKDNEVKSYEESNKNEQNENLNSEIPKSIQIINADISLDKLKVIESHHIIKDNDENHDCLKLFDTSEMTQIDGTKILEDLQHKDDDLKQIISNFNEKVDLINDKTETNDNIIVNNNKKDLSENNTIIDLKIEPDSILNDKETGYENKTDINESKEEFNNKHKYKNTYKDNNIVEDLNKATLFENNDQINDTCDLTLINHKENIALLLFEDNNAIIKNEVLAIEGTQLLDSCTFDNTDVKIKYEDEKKDNLTYYEQITVLDSTDNNISTLNHSEPKDLETTVISIIDDNEEKCSNQIHNMNIVDTILVNNSPNILDDKCNAMMTNNETISVGSIEKLEETYKPFENDSIQLDNNLEIQKITILNDVSNIEENLKLTSKNDMDNTNENILKQEFTCINDKINCKDDKNQLNTVSDDIIEIQATQTVDDKLNLIINDKNEIVNNNCCEIVKTTNNSSPKIVETNTFTKLEQSNESRKDDTLINDNSNKNLAKVENNIINIENENKYDEISCVQNNKDQIEDYDTYNVAGKNALFLADNNTELDITEIDTIDCVQIMNRPNINDDNFKEINIVEKNQLENEDNLEYKEINEFDITINEPVKHQSQVLFEKCKDIVNEDVVNSDSIHSLELKLENLNEIITDHLIDNTEISLSNDLEYQYSINTNEDKGKLNEINHNEIKTKLFNSNDIENNLENTINNITQHIAENTENKIEQENINLNKYLTELPKNGCSTNNSDEANKISINKNSNLLKKESACFNDAENFDENINNISNNKSQNIAEKIINSSELIIDDLTEIEQKLNLENSIENEEFNVIVTNDNKTENLVEENKKETKIYNNEPEKVNNIKIDHHSINFLEKNAKLQDDLIPEGKINNLSIIETVNAISLKPKLHCVEQMVANRSENNMLENVNILKQDNNMNNLIDCAQVEHELNIAAIGNIVFDYDTIKENTLNEVDKQISMENASITTVDKHLNTNMLKYFDILKAPNENLIMNKTNVLADEEKNNSINKLTELCENNTNTILFDQIHELIKDDSQTSQTQNKSIADVPTKLNEDPFIQEDQNNVNKLNNLDKSLNKIVVEPLNIVHFSNNEFKNKEPCLVEFNNEESCIYDKNNISKIIIDTNKEVDIKNKSLTSDILSNICSSENKIDNILKDIKENVSHEKENSEQFELDLKLGVEENIDKNMTTFFQKENDKCVLENKENNLSNINIIDHQDINKIDKNNSSNTININSNIKKIKIELCDKENIKTIETKLEKEIPKENEECTSLLLQNENDKCIVEDIKNTISNNNQIENEEIKQYYANKVISTKFDTEEEEKKQGNKKIKKTSPPPQDKKSLSPDKLMEISSDKNKIIDKNIYENKYISVEDTENNTISSNKFVDKLEENKDKQNIIQNTIIENMENIESTLDHNETNTIEDNDIDNSEIKFETENFEKNDNKKDKHEVEDIEQIISHNDTENQENIKSCTSKAIVIEDGTEKEKKKRESKKKRTSLEGTNKSPSPDKSLEIIENKTTNINMSENDSDISYKNVLNELNNDYKDEQNALQKPLIAQTKNIESILHDEKSNTYMDNDINNCEKPKTKLKTEISEKNDTNTLQSHQNKNEKHEVEYIENKISHNDTKNQENIKSCTNKTILKEDNTEKEKKKRGSKKKRTSLQGKKSPSPDKSLEIPNDINKIIDQDIEKNKTTNIIMLENESTISCKKISDDLIEEIIDEQNKIQKNIIPRKENIEIMLHKNKINTIENDTDIGNNDKMENNGEIFNENKIAKNNNNEEKEYKKEHKSLEFQNKKTNVDINVKEIQKSVNDKKETDTSSQKIEEQFVCLSQEVDKIASNELEKCNSKKSKRRDSKSKKLYEEHIQSKILKENEELINNSEISQFSLYHESLDNNILDINCIPHAVFSELREGAKNSNIPFGDNSQDKIIKLTEIKKTNYDNKLDIENYIMKNSGTEKIKKKTTVPINDYINYNITDYKERDWRIEKEISSINHVKNISDCQTNKDIFLDNFSMATDKSTCYSREFKLNPKTLPLIRLDEPSKISYDLGNSSSKRFLDMTDAYKSHVKPLMSRSLTPEPRCMFESTRYLGENDTNKYRSSCRSLSPYSESLTRQNVDSFSTRNRWLATYRSPSETIIRHNDLSYPSYGAMRRHGSDSFLHDSKARNSAYFSKWKLSERVSSSLISTNTEDLNRTKDIFKRLYFCVRLMDQTVSLGNRVKFWCSIIGYPEPRVQWYKDGQRLNCFAYSSSTRYQMRYINGLAQLIVENAQSCDSGEYTCVAANSRDRISTTGYLTIYTSPSLFGPPSSSVERFTKSTHLDRQYSWSGDVDLQSNIRFRNNYYDCRSLDDFTFRYPKNPKFITSIIADDMATYGGTIALQVRVQGSPLPNVTWMRESKPLPRSSSKYIYLDEGGLFTLLVKDSTVKDGGTYVCRACNLYGTADVEKSVRVVSSQDYSDRRGVKPAIIVSRPNDRLNVAVGEDITVTLRVAGEPKPKVIWMRGSRDVTFFDRSLKETVNDYVKLSIKKAQLSDAGTYFIIAKNVYGSDRAFVTVGVKKRARSLTPPQIRNTISRWPLLRYGGNNRGSYSNNKVPGPIRSEPTVSDRANNRISLTWDKPEKAETILVFRVEVQSTEEECWRQVGMTPTNSIDIYNLKPGYRYKFRVTARNRFGWGQPVVTTEYVDIAEPKYLPEFCQPLPGETKILLHHSATLQCHVRRVPKPFRVTWYKDGDPLLVNEKYTTGYTDRGKCTLTITNAVDEDSGRYACEAINDQGRVCTLTVVEVIANRRLVEAERRLQGCLMKNNDFNESVPIFTKRLIDRRVEINSTVRLSCQINGLPLPLILWYKDGEPVDFTGNNKNPILDSDNFSTLELTDVTYDDSGLYKAVASNSIGTTSTCCLLEVMNKNHTDLAIPQFIFDLPFIHEATDSIVLNAQIEAYRPAKVEWFRDGIQLRNGRRVDIITDHDGKLELRIAGVTKRDSGKYSLRVSNDTGIIESHCDVNVVEHKHCNTSLEQISLINHLYSEKPKFVIKPKFQEVEEGQEVVIDSEIVGDPLPKITWLRDGLKTEYYRDNSEFLCISNGNRYQLKIPHAKLTHTGTYTLLATNPHGQIKALISLQVFSPGRCKKKMENGINNTTVERLPKINRGLVDIECCENETVVFECKLNITQETDVRWKKDGRLVRLGKDIKSELVDGDTACLKIFTVSPLHEGLYTCIAFNELGQDSTSARLILSNSHETKHKFSNGKSNMHSSPILADESNDRSSKRLKWSSAPKFYAVLHDKIADVGDTVRFQCSVSGHPPPWSSWEKDDQPIGINSRIRIREDNDHRSLEICDLTSDDAGIYRVTVENKYGKIQTTARLEVWSHNQTNDVKISSSTNGRRQSGSTACAGEDFTLSCDIRGNSMSDVTWYKNDEEINDCSDRVTSNRDELTARLSISNLELADTGVYTCIARCNGGVTKCSTELCVFDTKLAKDSYLQPPIFVDGLVPKRTVSEGERVELTVKLQGAVPMSATWFKDDALVPDCEDFTYVVGDNGKFGLSIVDPFSADSGTYSCKVINKFGEAVSGGELVINEMTSDKLPPASQRTADLQTEFNNNLNVNEKKSTVTATLPATILWGPCDTTVFRGARVVLETSYAGNPEPCIQWLKAGKTLDSNGHLCITKADGISSLTIDSITADDCGKYGVQVDNGLGNDYHFASVAVEGPPDPPAGRPVVSVSETSADVTWSSPAYDGGCMVTGYSVEVRPFNQSDWKLVADKCYSLSHIVRGLAPGESYVFRVRAENMHGSSEASSESIPVYILQTDYGNTLEPKKVNIETGELFTKQYEVLDELGKGRYGVVHKVKERESGKYYAAKFVRCIKSKDKEKAKEEIDVMNCLRHPKLLQLDAAFDNPREVVMVTEYISGGELFERVVADDFTLTEKDCILFTRQICEGVDYMHKQNVVHLDLKPENIMCQSRTSHQIKLIDFGLAQIIEPGKPVRVLFGTPEFIPPEIISYEPIGLESDMWSIGVICYVLLSGLSPFMGENDAETFTNITKAEFDFDDEAFDAISQDSKDFISALLIKRKEKRLNAKECLKHKWLAQQDMDMSCVILSTDKLKKFIIRRKWQKTGNAIRALGRMATLSAASRRGGSGTGTVFQQLKMASLSEEDSAGESSSPSPPHGDRRPSAAVSVQSSRPTIGTEELLVVAKTKDGGVDGGGRRSFDARSDSGFSDCSSLASSTAHIRLSDKPSAIAEEKSPSTASIPTPVRAQNYTPHPAPVQHNHSHTHHYPQTHRKKTPADVLLPTGNAVGGSGVCEKNRLIFDGTGRRDVNNGSAGGQRKEPIRIQTADNFKKAIAFWKQ